MTHYYNVVHVRTASRFVLPITQEEDINDTNAKAGVAFMLEIDYI